MRSSSRIFTMALRAMVLFVFLASPAWAGDPRDLKEIKDSGEIRHLGIPYANFVTGRGDGLDVELMQAFARHLGVRYVYVSSEWGTIFGDLTGNAVQFKGNEVETQGGTEIRGDVIANGLTVLDVRRKIVDFSFPTFPTQVWLAVRTDSPVAPIVPSGDVRKDILATRQKVRGLSILGKQGTCLDPALYNLEADGARTSCFPGSLNDLAPALILDADLDAVLLDVPDALVALQKYPGRFKIVGPLSEQQEMAVAFARQSPGLRDEFNRFFAVLRQTGQYAAMVKKYYPSVSAFFPGFFNR